MSRLINAIAVFVLSASSLSIADAAEVSVRATFSSAEIRIIGDWYDDHRPTNSKKPGKGRRNGLPPGIAKNLTRGKSLPPGIAKHYLPEGLREILPARPTGHERIVVDGKVLLVEIGTQMIRDVLVDVIKD